VRKSLLSRTVTVVAAFVMLAGLSACVPPSTPDPGPGSTYQVQGTSVMSADKSVALRDLFVADPGPDGYQPGSSAPLVMQVWNNTDKPVSLVSASASGSVPVVLVGQGPADPASTAPPSSATFDVIVGPSSNTPLSQSTGRWLQIGCLSTNLKSGSTVEVSFTFSNGATITTNVPVGPQLPAAPAEPVALTGGC
jgi:copper(I)-binding protein